jgi:4-carboxymuconolactone decarboxylase
VVPVADPVLDPKVRALVRLSAALTVGEEALLEAMDRAAEVAPAEAEEVMLQSYLFLGFPVALNALGLWRRRTGRPAPSASQETPELWAERGDEVCRAVYTHQYAALREVMQGVHPDLDRWAIVEGYGKLLGRPGLELRVRELCVGAQLAGIVASRQLHAHLRGCLNVGAEPAEVEAALEAVADIVGEERSAAAERVWVRVKERWMALREG